MKNDNKSSSGCQNLLALTRSFPSLSQACLTSLTFKGVSHPCGAHHSPELRHQGSATQARRKITELAHCDESTAGASIWCGAADWPMKARGKVMSLSVALKDTVQQADVLWQN